MSGLFFDLPSIRFLRRFRFLEPVLQTVAASLFRCLSVPARALREVHFRHDEAEFPLASQSACKKFDWTLDDSRAADGVPNLFGALRPFNNWTKIKDQHELLFIRKRSRRPRGGGRSRGKHQRFLDREGAAENQEKTFRQRGGGFLRKRGG